MSAPRSKHSAKSYFTPVLVDPSDERRIVDFRPLGFRDVVVLGRYQYANAHPALEPHSHGKMVEICYLESGQQTYDVGDEKFHLNGGDVFVTFPHECHGSDRTPQGKGVLYWVLINVPSRQGRLLTLPQAETRMVFDRLLNLPLRQFSSGKEIGRILRQVIELSEHGDDPLRLVRMRNLLLGFLLAVLEASRHAERCVSPAIMAVQVAIGESLDRALPVRRLASLAHLSESRFKARFKAEVGVPPAEYVMRQRIERAKLLLRQSDLPVTEIALRLGFSGTQYFATAFKRYLAQTPSGYRRQCQRIGKGMTTAHGSKW
jgi:AraC-like DNA-binding protein